MAETTEKLLPCPFCGESVAEIQLYEQHDKTFYHVRCDECGVLSHGGYHMSPKGAVEQWNTRAAPARKCDAQSVRAATIEECAKVCDAHAKWADGKIREDEAPESMHNQLFGLVGNTANDCAGLIRALVLTKPAQAAWVCPKCGSRGTTDGTSSTLREKPAQWDVQGIWEPTEAQLNSACLSYNYGFGMLPDGDRNMIRFAAREWLRAWQKEGALSETKPAQGNAQT